MPKYDVYATATIGKYLGTFEASSPDAAEQEASEHLPGRLCNYCEGRVGDMGDWEFKSQLVKSKPTARSTRGRRRVK